jgi:hypothetical protein
MGKQHPVMAEPDERFELIAPDLQNIHFDGLTPVAVPGAIRKLLAVA